MEVSSLAEKTRVYQLAKDLGITSKELIGILQELNVDVKSHMSTLEFGVSDQVLDYLTRSDKVTEGEHFQSEIEETEGVGEYQELLSKKDRKDRGDDEIEDLEEEEFQGGKRKIRDDKKKKKKKWEGDILDTILTGEKTKPAKIKKKKRQDKQEEEEVTEEKFELTRIVYIVDPVSVKELATRMELPPNELIKEFIRMKLMVSLNQLVSADNAAKVAERFGIAIEVVDAYTEEIFEEKKEEVENLVSRPPVVTVMGHVDHGKTSLLDSIRATHVTDTEAGGITQSIGAYQVEVNGHRITFIDTPGHEAFTQMRARGANITDIVVLVVAADDGVMPQTIEAVSHARAAKISGTIPIIVAINKIDKPQSNPDRVKQQLAELGLVPEQWGGDTITVPVSARTKDGINDLLDMILLQSEMLELKANPDKKARGTILEAKLDKQRGPVATVIVQQGTLREGDAVIAGLVYGKIRAMTNYKGERLKEAYPAMPVEITGLSDVPQAGDDLFVCENDRKAKQLATGRAEKVREEKMKSVKRVTLTDLFKQLQDGQIKELNIIIKADTQGSVEAMTQALNKLSTDEVRVNVILGGVGAINERDIMLASASNAIIIGFNVRSDSNIVKLAENENIDVRFYRIIYQAIDDIKAAMAGLLEPIYREVPLGKAEIRATFNVSKVGVIGGAYVLEGKITRSADVRVLRDNVVICEGKISSLKRFKDDAREVLAGYECGIGVEKFNGLCPKDIIEAYELQPVMREL
ncbi:MAG: translation initiation factor IF-2 [Candidatus Eremiobacterota bacterium]